MNIVIIIISVASAKTKPIQSGSAGFFDASHFKFTFGVFKICFIEVAGRGLLKFFDLTCRWYFVMPIILHSQPKKILQPLVTYSIYRRVEILIPVCHAIRIQQTINVRYVLIPFFFFSHNKDLSICLVYFNNYDHIREMFHVGLAVFSQTFVESGLIGP